MQNTLAARSGPAIDGSMSIPVPEGKSGQPPRAQKACADHQFVAMLDSYRDSGGLARVKEVAELVRCQCNCDLNTLTSRIVNQLVICFEWQSQLWLPLFQFNRSDMTLQTGLSPILAELGPGLDAWEMACWFAQPNRWLGDCTPAARLRPDPLAVLHAARAICSVRHRTDRHMAFG